MAQESNDTETKPQHLLYWPEMCRKTRIPLKYGGFSGSLESPR